MRQVALSRESFLNVARTVASPATLENPFARLALAAFVGRTKSRLVRSNRTTQNCGNGRKLPIELSYRPREIAFQRHFQAFQFMHQYSQLSSAVRRVAIVSLILLVAMVGQLKAQPEDNLSPIEVAIGVGGIAKLGHWVPVRFDVDSELESVATKFRVTVLDGDDTPNSMVGPLIETGNGSFYGLMQFGRTYGDATFELLDTDGKSVADVRTTIRKQNNEFMELIPSTGRLLACMERPPEKEALSFASQFEIALPGGMSDDDRIVSITLPNELPQTAMAYESCETLILLANDESWIKEIPTNSIRAIEAWVRNGGHLVIAAAPDQGALFQGDGPLQWFAPGKVAGDVETDSSRRIEEFCSSKEPYLGPDDSMQVLQITDVAGRTVLKEGDTPLIIRSPRGLGEITFVTFDPTEKQFLDWSASSRFAQSLMQLRIGEDGTQASSDTRNRSAVRHSGYDDLVGQMKVPLERFTSLRFIPFALIAALIALYILCIGVGDWFLVGRLFKKHELTWLTFPLIATAFCAIAWYAASASRPSTIQINQVELIDIDSESGHVRTTAWANLYSPAGETVDLKLGVRDTAGDHDLKLETSRITWLGLPGDGLGGMLNRANPGLYRTGYRQQLSPATDDPTKMSLDMKGLELQVSSTRPLFAQWNGKFEGRAESRLKDSRIESRFQLSSRLEGTFSNPFDFPLRDCKLFHNDLVYIMRGTLAPGDVVDIRSDTTEKTVRSFLTRRTRRADDKDKSQSVAWDSRDVNLSRIMHMMMFYHGSGGENYTGLTNAYHDFVEMTPNVSMDRAILVGQLKDRISAIEIDGDGADEFYDSSLTLVRILLPVEVEISKRKR